MTNFLDDLARLRHSDIINCLVNSSDNFIKTKEEVLIKADKLYTLISSQDETLIASFYMDYLLLYQVFSLFGDERKSTIEKVFEAEIAQINASLKTNTESPPFSMQDLLGMRIAKSPTPFDKNTLVQECLYIYMYSTKLEYDTFIDTEIMYFFSMFLQHRRNPKDLFYTDHNYICDQMAYDIEQAKYLRETENPLEYSGVLFGNPYCVLPRLYNLSDYTEIKECELYHWAEAYTYAKIALEIMKLMYELRTLFPKKDFIEDDKTRYDFENYLFNRTLFNKASVKANSSITQPSYIEPEDLLRWAKQRLSEEKELNKSVWACLYLASKEVYLDDFQDLFLIKSKKKRDYEQCMFKSFKKIIGNTAIFSDFARDILKGKSVDSSTDKTKKDIIEILENLEQQHKAQIYEAPTELSKAQKKLFQGLFFMSMWEKLSYKKISNKNIDADLQEMHGIAQQNSIQEQHVHYFSKNIHALFAEKPIEALPEILREATILLGMSKSGLNYDFLDFEKTITHTSDIITLLYSLSRIKRESTPGLITTLNLLREKQKSMYPIIKNSSLDRNNLKKVRRFDKGFTINLFESTIAPLQYPIDLLKNTDIDNRYIYTKKTVKFVCETDKAYTGKKDTFERLSTYKKCLDSMYLYKVRNQYTHFSLDENVDFLYKPKNIHLLLQVLIEAYKKYYVETEKILHFWERKGIHKTMLESHPYKIITPMHITTHIKTLIEAICTIITIKHKNISQTTKNTLLQPFTDFSISAFNKLKESLDSDELKEIKSSEGKKSPIEFEQYELTEVELAKAREIITTHKKDKNLSDYLQHIEQMLLEVLNFLFTTDVQEQSSKIQYDDFFETYHTESAYYMLYLAQFFLDGFSE